MAEVRQAVVDMGNFKATGAFGINIGTLKVALAYAPTVDFIIALL